MESTNVIRRTPQPAPPAPEEEQGLLGALGSSALSGIGMLGNFLDLPGSMVRDVATFNNPFDQLLSPLSHENRATGREMTTAWGITSENKETGWVPFEDPAEFAQDAIGFAAELALDPLGWATGWFKGGAAAAKAANLAGDVGQSAGRIGRTLDKVGNVMDKMDPGFHIGRKVENAYGDTIRAAAKPHISRMSAAAKVAKGRFTDWLDKYDAPTITPTELAHDFAILKAKRKNGRSSIAEDSELLTQLTPMQKMVQRAAQGMGADVHYYGSAKGKHYAAGVSITDFSSRIWVSGDMADGGLLNVAGHEALHLLRNTDPKGFRQLVTNIMEKAKDGKGEIAKGTASYGGDIPPGMELEEGIAMMAGLAWEDSNLWRTIANDPNVAPTFRHAFGDVLGKMTKGMTTGETKVINEIIGDFMYGQREVMAAGGDTARRNQKKADMLDDLDFVDQYQSGMGKFAQSSVDPLTRTQQFGQEVDHYARATAKAAIDITERLGRSLQAQINYKVRGKATRQGQEMGRDATEGTESLLQEFYEPLTALADEMVDLGRVDNDTWREVRKAIEMDNFKELPETLQQPAKHLKQTFAKVHKRGIRAGMKRNSIADVMDFFHRKMTPEMEAALGDVGMATGTNAKGADLGVKAGMRRTDLFRGFADGTDGVDEVVGNKTLINWIRYGDTGTLRQTPELLRQKYGGRVDPRLPLRKKTGEYIYMDMENKFHSISEEELFANYKHVDNGIDIRNVSENVRRQLYGERMMMEGTFIDNAGNPVAQEIELVTSVTKEYDHHVPDRFEALTEWMSKKGVADLLESQDGLFRNSPAADASSYLNNEAYKIAVAESMTKLFGNMFESDVLVPQYSGNAVRRTGASLDELFNNSNFAHLDRNVIFENMRQHSKKINAMANAAPDDWKRYLGGTVVPKEVVADLTQAAQIHQLPESLEAVTDLFRSSTSLFKAGVLTAPARYTRDFFSGQMKNMNNDMFSFEAGARAKSVLMNQPDAALAQMPEIQAYAKRTGMLERPGDGVIVGDKVQWTSQGVDQFAEPMRVREIADGPDGRKWAMFEGTGTGAPLDDLSIMQKAEVELTPELATKAARRMFASMKRDGSNIRRDANVEQVGSLFPDDVGAVDLAESLPGTHGSFKDLGKDLLDHMIFRKGSKAPWDIEGVQHVVDPSKGIRRRNQNGFQQFGPVEAGNILGKNADDMNRLVGWIELMRQGQDAKAAFKRATEVQLDYRPQTFGPAEQVFLKKIFPFYSFFSRESAYLAKELMTNPAGRLGKLIRLQRHADSQQDDQYVPEHVRAQMALPLGDSADGGKNYLTGVGLMHEDPVATIMGAFSDPQTAARNLLSKSNPMLKGVAEYGLGRSAFQGGPMGGRDLHDMDPNVGRILTQLGIQDPTPSGQAAPVFGSRGLEFLVSNSPVSRLVSSTKTALDSRKSLGERAANLLTGMRITTVSPEQSRRGLRDIGNAIARDAGARPFSTFHISDDLLSYVKEKSPEKYKLLRAVKDIRDQWNEERRAIRREAKAP